MARNLKARFTFDPADDVSSVWSPDGSRILFNSRRKGVLDIYQKLSNGTGSEDMVFSSRSHTIPTDVSFDGTHLLCTMIGANGTNDMWLLPLFGDRKPVPFVEGPRNQQQGRFSPDGRWVAYVSDESGRNEIYVVPFPKAGGKWQVSTAGGLFPHWGRDSREVYYLAPDNQIMAAAVTPRESGFDVGVVRPLFETRPRLDVGWPYAMSADAQRFLVNTLVQDVAPSSVTLLVNWPALLAQ